MGGILLDQGSSLLYVNEIEGICIFHFPSLYLEFPLNLPT